MTKKLLLVVGALAATGAAIGAAVLALAPSVSALTQVAGRYDNQSTRTQTRMEFVDGGEKVVMVGELWSNANGTRWRFVGDTTVAGETVAQTIVGVDRDIWVTMPELLDLMPEGKMWIHMADGDEVVGNTPPSVYISILERSPDINERRTRLRGRPVTLYAGKVNAREIAEATGGDFESKYSREVGDRDLLVPVAVWVGDGGKLERLHVKLQSNDLRFDEIEYGVPANIPALAPEQTVEEAEWNRLLEETPTTG